MTGEKNTTELFNSLARKIEENDDFLIITHIFPDGDAIGSLTAFHKFISALGKNSQMVCNSGLPYQYSFLPGFDKIKKAADIKELNSKAYVCIVLDCADQERTGMDLDQLKVNGSYIINLDHHKSNNLFGDINIVDSERSAASEIVFEFLIKDFKTVVDYDIALGIYVGILTDTGKFQYSNTTANVHYITGKLLEYGINPSGVYGHIYESDPFGRFRLIQIVFDRIKFVKPLGLIYSYVLVKDFIKLKIPAYAQEGIIEMLRSAKGVRVAALIKQISNSSYKISLRTSEIKIDLSRIAAGFNGGGHRAASAYRDKGSLREVTSRLENAVRKETGE